MSARSLIYDWERDSHALGSPIRWNIVAGGAALATAAAVVGMLALAGIVLGPCETAEGSAVNEACARADGLRGRLLFILPPALILLGAAAGALSRRWLPLLMGTVFAAVVFVLIHGQIAPPS